jgi:hypothetical protein
MMRARAAADAAFAEEAARAPVPSPVQNLAGSGFGNQAQGADLAGQFQFTLNRPVSIRSRMSAMIPLVEGRVDARRTLVFQGSRAQGGRTIHPATGAEITNRTGMKLPAGPLTIYDGGSYAGDALVDFFPDGETRIISWGEDLSVTGAAVSAQSRSTAAVTVSRGVMTVSRRLQYETVYTFRNSAQEAKNLIIEHPATPGTELAEGQVYTGRGAAYYRFAHTVPAASSAGVTITEVRPLQEQITLTRLGMDALLSYSTNQEIPLRIRSALEEAAALRRNAENARAALAELESRRARLAEEQDRIRRNLEAAGSTTLQGQEYLRRLGAQDTELDALAGEINTAGAASRAAQSGYESYLESLSF